MTSVVVMVLCNQPEAFASDLSDNQSRYLYIIAVICVACHSLSFFYFCIILL